MMIKRTHIPFWPQIRISGLEITDELYEEIKKCANLYNKSPHDFSARIELIPIPGEKEGHYLNAEVTYEKGELK